ncbi:MAG: hypothetical protein WBP79_08385 [Candidatus Acidiferrales bacterium]
MEMKQLTAVFGALAFLGTIVALGTAAAFMLGVRLIGEERIARAMGAVSSWFFGGRGGARKIAFVAAMLVAGYGIALLGASAASREWALGAGEEKYFCEIDCHIAYAVANVEKAKTLGIGGEQKTANGNFYVVSVRTRFDERTISPRRGDAPLTPGPRVVTVVDDQGHSYSISQDGQRSWEASADRHWTSMMQPLRPGESYTTQLVFDLPRDACGLKLLITSPSEPAWIGRVIIGDEDSIFHKKVYLRLES